MGLPLLEDRGTLPFSVDEDASQHSPSNSQHTGNHNQRNGPWRQVGTLSNLVSIGVTLVVLAVKTKESSWAFTGGAICAAEAIIHAVHAILALPNTKLAVPAANVGSTLAVVLASLLIKHAGATIHAMEASVVATHFHRDFACCSSPVPCACTFLGSWHVARDALAAIIADKGLLALLVLSFACCAHEAFLALTVSLTVCTFNRSADSSILAFRNTLGGPGCH